MQNVADLTLHSSYKIKQDCFHTEKNLKNQIIRHFIKNLILQKFINLNIFPFVNFETRNICIENIILHKNVSFIFHKKIEEF